MLNNLTPAQRVMLHVLESAVASIIITVVTGVIQFIATNGLNIQDLLAICGTLFLGALSMTYKSVKADPNLLPAIHDTLQEIKATIQPPAQPVVVNVHAQPAQPTVAPPAPQVAPIPVNPTGIWKLSDTATVTQSVPQLALPQDTYPLAAMGKAQQ